MACYDKYKRFFDHVVIYEDLLENPKEETLKLFEKLDIQIHPKHISNVLTAFKKDSQGQFFGHTNGTIAPVFALHQLFRMEDIFNKHLKLPINYTMTLNEFRAFVQPIEIY